MLITDCVFTELPNCSILSNEEVPLCTECNDSYYLKNAICNSVESPIPFCINYSSANTCSRCGNGYTRAQDGAICLSNGVLDKDIDPNCAYATINSTPHCVVCASGYYFKDRWCTAYCEIQSREKGCFACNPNKPEICLFCLSGFQMTPEGQCVKSRSLAGNRFKSKKFSSGEALSTTVILYLLLSSI